MMNDNKTRQDKVLKNGYKILTNYKSFTNLQILDFCSFELLNGEVIDNLDDVVNNKRNKALGKTQVKRFSKNDAVSYTSYLFMDNEFIYIINRMYHKGTTPFFTPYTIKAFPVILLPKNKPETWFAITMKNGVDVQALQDDDGDYNTSVTCAPNEDSVRAQCECFSTVIDDGVKYDRFGYIIW